MNLSKVDMPAILQQIYEEVILHYGEGKVANYIPPLSRVNPRQFGMAIRWVDGEEHFIGQAETLFSIQSISKLFALMLALDIVGDELWNRVGREPSGMRFNSLLQLENEAGIPRNPFINAGAIVVTDTIVSHSASPVKRLEQFMASLSGNPGNRFDSEVYNAEAATGFRNAAIANLLKAMGNLEGQVNDVLDAYFKQCSMTMSCLDLARATECLANKGRSTFRSHFHGEVMDKRINALMLTCGLYDAAGNFAYRVGLPAKSGVGGGIVAIVPGHCSVAVWSPELDEYGNSVLGQRALELLTTYTGSSIF
ncbi:glutaminase [Hahella ganghwensis]|uniref:glutaminase n=1 Tax=Hahella ganghwensis TaxID=286420 RepID=UPI000365B37A|nr:glutaminase [Hahella ganghwensis]